MIVVVPDCYRALTEVHLAKLNDYVVNGPLEAFSSLAEHAYRLPELSDAVRQRVGKLDVDANGSTAVTCKKGQILNSAGTPSSTSIPTKMLVRVNMAISG